MTVGLLQFRSPISNGSLGYERLSGLLTALFYFARSDSTFGKDIQDQAQVRAGHVGQLLKLKLKQAAMSAPLGKAQAQACTEQERASKRRRGGVAAAAAFEEAVVCVVAVPIKVAVAVVVAHQEGCAETLPSSSGGSPSRLCVRLEV
jgi:hypothetical protein